MDENLYDEFGNYIGDVDDSDAESEVNVSTEIQDESDVEMEEDHQDKNQEQQEEQQAIVLHEDKKYHPTISQTFAPDVEVAIHTSDAQTLSEPLVKPVVAKKIIVEEKNLPTTSYSRDYLASLAHDVPDRIRNVSLVGNLHSGKTSFLDMLILQTHPYILEENQHLKTKNFKSLRYSDNHKLEIERGLSLKTSAATLILPNLKSTSVVVNIFDSPGHVNFSDEIAAAQRLSDTSILIIDIVEGLTMVDKVALKNAIANDIAINIVLNKIDRLILELKLPILDAYYKIRYTIEEINHYISHDLRGLLSNYSHSTVVSPELNNVCFASAKLQFVFNLTSFATKYLELNNIIDDVDVTKFATRLWGDSICYNEATGKFYKKTAKQFSHKNSFIFFVLEPIYKLISISISKDHQELSRLLYDNFKITLHKNYFKLDSQILLTKVFQEFFKSSFGFADMIEHSAPSPVANAPNRLLSQFDAPLAKLKKNNNSSNDSNSVLQAVKLCSSDGPLIANVAKLMDTPAGDKFYGLTRIYSGALRIGQVVKLLNESYSADENNEDFVEFEIKELFIPCARYNFEVSEVAAGGICLIGGEISQFINKSATLYDGQLSSTEDEPLYAFKQIDYITSPVFKISIKPDMPSHLPELLSSLQNINKSYLGAQIKVEESGEYVISGSGELYLDCLLYDLRYLYADKLEIKVSEPFVRFEETITEKSLSKLTIHSNNGKNSISLICEPLEDAIVKDLSSSGNGANKLVADFDKLTKRQVAKIFQTQYGWDALAARSIWSVGPKETNGGGGTNILVDDTLPDEVNKDDLNFLKESIIQGFAWAVKQGPLCDETISNVKFRIIGATLSEDVLERGSGQILPMVRKACYATFLISTPKLLEPIYEVSITCTKQSVDAIDKILSRRRGGITERQPIVATQLLRCTGYIPVMDSVGFETDLRLLTQGQAMCLLRFHEWGLVSGDPLDKDAFIPKLKPASSQSLARDLVVKTRRRKGLNGEPSLEKYLDDKTIGKLRDNGVID